MNLVLFESAELRQPLPCSDPRIRHVLEVLHRRVGEAFDAGVIDGPRGKALLRDSGPESVCVEFSADTGPTPLAPVTLIVGLPRPQTARDILRDATTFGVSALHFVRTDKGDPNYAQSTLWSSGEWRRHVLAGAEQAFSTMLPRVTHGRSLAETIASLPLRGARCALDNYESTRALSHVPLDPPPITLALGAERGWSAAERELLRAHRFEFAHLGDRVLRTETACLAAVTLVRAKLGLI